MDSQIMESIAGFDALWQRVTGREEPARGDAPDKTYALADALRHLIREQACAAAGAAALSRLMQGEGRAVLARQAAEGRRQLRRLQAEHYILTGVTAGPAGDCPPPADRLSSLREAFLRAGQLAELYGQTAHLADCPELAQTLDGFAAAEQGRARQLRALLVEHF